MENLNALLAIDLNYIIIGLMVVFYSLEQLLGTEFNFDNRPWHLFHNALFQVAFVIGNIFFAAVTVYSIEWLNVRQVGLLYLIQVPVWLKLVLGVFLFDFVNYWFHRAAHKTPLIWRFHRVHHSDASMDSSTFFRAHPVELILWFGTSNIVAAGIFGLDLMSLGFFFLVATPFFILEHSNLRFPRWLDQTFGLLFTTPNIHKIHHEQDQYYTDSNFADVFIIWDRIFGTYKYKPVEQITFGLKEFKEDKHQTFWYQFKSPFININRIHSDEEFQEKQN